MDRIFKKPHPDDRATDTILFETIPRYKASDLSGDEWRISIQIRFFKKGHLLLTKTYTSMKFAVADFPRLMAHLCQEEGFTPLPKELSDSLCDQPGCPEQAVSTYEIKEEYARNGEGPLPKSDLTKIRKFCHKHLQRGDCGLEDSDTNYEVIVGPGPEGSTMEATDESPSLFAGTINIDLTEEDEGGEN